MEVSADLKASSLYIKLQEDGELETLLRSVRAVVAELAATTVRSVPGFTDHTVYHMDKLWLVADQLLSEVEILALSTAEAFLLGVSFYLHDVGMAYAATEKGLERIKLTDSYRAFIANCQPEERSDPSTIAAAVALAVRDFHANAAVELSTGEIPGSGGYYIFPNKRDRELWALTAGQLASSHHWSTSQLENTYGRQRDVPLPGGRTADLLYVAACLRLIDYAHINRDRASSIARAFRLPLGKESLKHWLAQEHIDGPHRDRWDYLTYRAANPISNVDAWWLFYELVRGLDEEIQIVTRSLDLYSKEFKRISVKGVRGAKSPQEAVNYIPTSGFLPIEINLRTGSIEKLVELLAGESLYGPNPMAAVRELIQNARDAMALKAAVAVDAADRAALTLPISVNLSTTHADGSLEVVDHGIGMNRLVMTDYLISIASNYWVSQVSRDFPEAALTFKSAGKFGIGFLSVFMLGDEVVVESNRQGSERLKLTLNGVGRRGELLEVRSPSGSGTSVRIKLKKGLLKKFDDLPRLIRTYAPTLPFGITISVDESKHHLVEGWIKTLSCSELEAWTIESSQILNRAGPALGRRTRGGAFFPGDYLLESRFLLEMRVGGPARRHLSDSYPWRDKWPEYTRGNTRLVASFFGESVLSMRGLAVQMIQTPGCAGILELDNLETDVARSRVLNENASHDTLKAAREAFIPSLTLALDAVGGAMTITNVLELLARCVGLYGPEAVRNSAVPWISQLTLPGNVETISCSTLVARLIDTRSCFVAFNVGPWSSLKHWVETSSGGVPGKDELAVVLDDAGQRGPGYVSGEKKLGALRELWEELDANSLFFILIGLVAEAWQLSPGALLQQGGWTHDGGTIYGRFIRP